MGFKKTSDVIAISFGVAELGPNTFIQDEIALQLDVLNNEIFVVVAADLDLTPPDAVAGLDTDTTASICATSKATVTNLSDTNCISTARDSIRAAGFVDGGVAFAKSAGDTPLATLDYLAIIATNDFFLQIQGAGNGGAKSGACKVYGYRARADASVYAALVQSEVLSS